MTDESESLDPNEIEDLLRQAEAADGSPASAAAPIAAAPANPTGDGPASETPVDGDIDLLLQQAEEAIASIDRPNDSPDEAVPFQFRNLSGTPANETQATLELLQDVDLDVRIELGRTVLPIEDLLRLSKGAVVPLDRLAGDPVDVYVNERLIARGEILVVNDNFCVRVGELVTSNQA